MDSDNGSIDNQSDIGYSKHSRMFLESTLTLILKCGDIAILESSA